MYADLNYNLFTNNFGNKGGLEYKQYARSTIMLLEFKEF